MKKILAILCLLTIVCACKATSNSSTKGNRKITSVERSIDSYSEISVAGSCDVIYEQKSNSKPYLRIEVDENLHQYIKAEVNNGVLEISVKGKNIRPTKLRAYTNSTSISKVRIAGSGDITLKNSIKSNSLDISIAGSGDFTAKNILCDKFKVSIAGSGDAHVAGKATDSNISIKGSGDVDAINLITKQTRCTVNGSGDAKVYSTDELSVQVSGSGDIRFKGTPKQINKSVKGSGSISSI